MVKCMDWGARLTGAGSQLHHVEPRDPQKLLASFSVPRFLHLQNRGAQGKGLLQRLNSGAPGQPSWYKGGASV